MYEVRLSTVNVSGAVVLPTRARSAGRLPPVTVTWSVVGVAPGATASVPLKTYSWPTKRWSCGARCQWRPWPVPAAAGAALTSAAAATSPSTATVLLRRVFV